MAMPSRVGIVDTMIGFPHGDMKAVYSFITRQTKDRESREDFEFPVEFIQFALIRYDSSQCGTGAQYQVSRTLSGSDRNGVRASRQFQQGIAAYGIFISCERTIL